MKLALVTTTRNGGDSLVSFVRYHLALGFDRLYLFFDDANDPDRLRVEGCPGVVATRCDEVLRRRQARSAIYPRVAPFLSDVGQTHRPQEQVMAQQELNTLTALEMARDEGIGWLLHIDVDEAFLPEGDDLRRCFARLDRQGGDTVIFLNDEAVPERMEGGDYFTEMTLFKKNPATLPPTVWTNWAQIWPRPRFYFLAYDNGKSAARVHADIVPQGVHRFGGRAGRLHSVTDRRARVLHYPYSGFERYWRKHALLGDFRTDRVLGNPWSPPAMLAESRPFVVAGDREGARQFYARTALFGDPAEVSRHCRRGLMERIPSVAQRLGQTAASQANGRQA
jgi:hypothetical protein